MIPVVFLALMPGCGGGSPRAHDMPAPVPMEVARSLAPAPAEGALALSCTLPVAVGVESFVGGYGQGGEAIAGSPAQVSDGGIVAVRMPAEVVRVRVWVSGFAPVEVPVVRRGDRLVCGEVPPMHPPARLTGTVSGLVAGAWVEGCGLSTDVRGDGFYDLMVPAGVPCELSAARTTADGWKVATPGLTVTLSAQEVRRVDLALPDTD